MTTLLKPAAGFALNIAINGAAAYAISRLFKVDNPEDVTVVVTTDTVFRIAIVHVLTALKLPPEKVGTWGHLIFPCLTFLTQPVSIGIAQKMLNIRPPEGLQGRSQTYYLAMMSYIFFAWKVNMMLKDAAHLTFPSLLFKAKLER